MKIRDDKEGISLTKEEKERKFENFINKTIVLSSKRYFKKEMHTIQKEQFVLDDNEENSLFKDNSNFDNSDIKLQLNSAIQKLSDVEQTVIFLLFRQDTTRERASEILHMPPTRISKIKRRALNKIKEFLGGDL